MTTLLRPMNTGELLDRTFFLYRKHFVLFVSIVALPYLLTLLARVVFYGLTYSGRAFSSAGTLVAILLSGLIWLVAYLIALAAAQAATVVAVSDVHLDRPTSITGAFRAVARRLPEIMGIMLVVWILVLVGLLFLIVPGILIGLMWALVVPVAVLEGEGLGGAMRRSATLTKGNRGRIFVIFFLFTVLMYVVSIILQVPAWVILALTASRTGGGGAVMPLWFTAATSIGTFITQCLVGPLFTIATALIYYDERVRKEGFDMQLMMESLAPAPGNPTVAPAL